MEEQTQMTRRTALGAIGALTGAVAVNALSCAHGARSTDAGRRRPNLIFVMADDLGYGDLGAYGQERIQTPHLDRMAKEGVRFTQCYAGSTVCAPSRCVLMTGLHTGRCRVRGNLRVPLEPEDLTVAEVLRAAGYRTGLVGKWGLGEPGSTGVPNRKGFDYFYGYLNQRRAHNYYPDYLWRNEERVPLRNTVRDDIPEVAIEREEYSHDLIMDEALAFIERERHQPFHLYLAVTLPHANNERGGLGGDEHGMEIPSLDPYADAPWPEPQRAHAAMITRLDRDMGRLFAQLERLGLDEDTIVFFTSDNGPHREGGADPDFFRSSGPLRGIKRDLYEGGIRVPMIVRGPTRVPAGVASDHVWGFQDWLPTAARLVGAAVPEGLDGLPMADAFLAGRDDRVPPAHEQGLYWEFHEGGFKQAMRLGDWKAVREGLDGPVELYDLARDLGETVDLAATHPDVAEDLGARMVAARTESEHWPVAGDAATA